ncbi:MGMT family protein [Patescibacteria group bacterium]|nr:MGMT family protein [Patescibacteria group bacterium]
MDKTFSERVVEATLSIPPGRVVTYGDIARVCGAGPMAAQSITTILGRAYNNGITNIPWHRIVYSGGKIWTSHEHHEHRMKLYRKEGIKVNKKGYIQNFNTLRYEF